MMVQFTGLSLRGLLFICSSHSWIEIHGPGRQATAPNRKGGVAVIDHLPETRVPFGVPYSSDPNSENISDLRKRGGCAGSVLKNRNFCRLGTVGKGTAQILHLCLHKINEKLAPRGTRQEPFLAFLMLALQAIESIVFAAITRA